MRTMVVVRRTIRRSHKEITTPCPGSAQFVTPRIEPKNPSTALLQRGRIPARGATHTTDSVAEIAQAGGRFGCARLRTRTTNSVRSCPSLSLLRCIKPTLTHATGPADRRPGPEFFLIACDEKTIRRSSRLLRSWRRRRTARGCRRSPSPSDDPCCFLRRRR